MIPILQRNSIAEILELTSNNPTLDEAKANYKRLVKIYHPDINKSPEAEQYMKRLNWAWDMAQKIVAHNERIQAQARARQPMPGHRIVIHVGFYGGGNMHFTVNDLWGNGTNGTSSF